MEFFSAVLAYAVFRCAEIVELLQTQRAGADAEPVLVNGQRLRLISRGGLAEAWLDKDLQ